MSTRPLKSTSAEFVCRSSNSYCADAVLQHHKRVGDRHSAVSADVALDGSCSAMTKFPREVTEKIILSPRQTGPYFGKISVLRRRIHLAIFGLHTAVRRHRQRDLFYRPNNGSVFQQGNVKRHELLAGQPTVLRPCGILTLLGCTLKRHNCRELSRCRESRHPTVYRSFQRRGLLWISRRSEFRRFPNRRSLQRQKAYFGNRQPLYFRRNDDSGRTALGFVISDYSDFVVGDAVFKISVFLLGGCRKGRKGN